MFFRAGNIARSFEKQRTPFWGSHEALRWYYVSLSAEALMIVYDWTIHSCLFERKYVFRAKTKESRFQSLSLIQNIEKSFDLIYWYNQSFKCPALYPTFALRLVESELTHEKIFIQDITDKFITILNDVFRFLCCFQSRAVESKLCHLI